MRVISDLHIHSKYSRACSKDLVPQNLDKWAKIKGVNLLGTGDFTHPRWFADLRESLEEAEPGFYKLRSSSPSPLPSREGKKQNFPPPGGGGLPARSAGGEEGGVRFVLSAEISCIYSQDGRLRRVHYVLLLPSFSAVEKFNRTLESKGGKLGSDGRPFLGRSRNTFLLLRPVSPPTQR